ncbi:MAG: rRNA maturation RNase YbeY [Anaerolineales bacterium]
MLYIELPEPPPADLSAALFENAVRAVFQQQQPNLWETADLSILLADDPTLHELNLQFMGVDAPTDVLSFPADEIDPETNRPYLGDIAISYARAFAQAQAGGHSVAHELQLLTVHGVLHLLGYDHAEPEEKARMWQAQSHILAALGVPLSPP